MKAAVLIKKGKASDSFEVRELLKPQPGNDEVLIKVSAFGLNFADVMARKGMYKEASTKLDNICAVPFITLPASSFSTGPFSYVLIAL